MKNKLLLLFLVSFPLIAGEPNSTLGTSVTKWGQGSPEDPFDGKSSIEEIKAAALLMRDDKPEPLSEGSQDEKPVSWTDTFRFIIAVLGNNGVS
jgi:hypothetical protein